MLGVIKPAPPQTRVATLSDSTKVVAELPKERPVIDTAEIAVDTSHELTLIDTAQNIPEDTVTIESKVWIVTLTNYGGGPISLKLKNYKYKGGGLIEMLPSCTKPIPEFIFKGGSFSASKPVYQASLAKGNYQADNSPLEISYTYQKDNVGQIIKKYRFYPERYDYDVFIEVINKNSFGFEREYSFEWNNPLEPTETGIADDYNAMWAMAFMGNERAKFDDYTDDKYNTTLSGSTSWIATRSKYFTSILIPRSNMAAGAKSSGVKSGITATDGSSVQKHAIAAGLVMEMPTDDRFIDSFTVFVGPMDYERLKIYGNNVVDILDIGTTPFVGWIIKIFAVPIMWLLPRMYALTPNYGFVIIIFSLIIKVLTFPLSKKTAKSMMAMKELQPKMDELKKKHKNNPQALNKEMMKLYKDMGINPFSGCLPYLPQMPLFFALFAVFNSTILLRQAPFILWWDDLSRGAQTLTDPYIVMVLLMMALMFVQQKMTMTDPKNKMLIYLMPLMMGFFFYKASAGLVLYWTSFSLFSFVEQLMFKPKNMGIMDVKS
jgi:YidC/Oxa1 family membrane protein insertase